MVNKAHMETVTTTTHNGSRQDAQAQKTNRRAAVNALALVGFIALILIGIVLAIYAVRYVPKLVSDLGAGVSLSSIFHDGEDDQNAALEVVTSTSSLPVIGIQVSTTTDSSDSDDEKNAPSSSDNGGSRGTGSAGTGTYTVTTVTTQTPINPHGDPDLAVTITGVGYLRDDGETDTFVSSGEVPDNKDGAVRFTVTNKGTNVSGRWKFEAKVPSSPSQTFESPYQDSLKPGDRIDFVLGFEDGREGNNRDITITVDPDDRIDESNERNNEAERSIDIED